MKTHPSSFMFAIASCFVLFAPKMVAQTNSIQLFGPVDVRGSKTGVTSSNTDTFNSNTLNLSCPAGVTPTAVLSSSASGSSNVLIDNYLFVTNLTNSDGPTNVCRGGVSESCFTSSYQGPAGTGSLDGEDPDSLVQNGGVPPIDISTFLVASDQPQQLKIDLVDQGGFVASSSLYLVTNCTSGGVNGPAMISGNTIPPTNPSNDQLDQDFTFNPVTDNQIGFEYDLTGAYQANTLTINPSGVNPQVGDFPLEPTPSSTDDVSDYTHLVAGTSFATSMCLVHSGEMLRGQPACKLFTLECTVGTGSSAAGANCPVSSASNERLSDVFDGPSFTLGDHQGMGFLMASEGWAGGPCTFDSASNLQGLPCPQNLLTSFSGPGTFSSTGQTTHPNSTFITVAQIPEALTTVTSTNSNGTPVNLGPGNWTNNATPYLQLSSQPPNLTVSGFVPSPILSISYGTSLASALPLPGTTTDTTLTNPAGCSGVALPFTPAPQPFSFTADGQYLLHYYAQDCAGTKELLFTNTNSDGTGTWSTHFYTFPINIDTVNPEASTPVLTPAPDALGNYQVGEVVTASYSCTDDRSGIVSCGSHNYSSDGTTDTGALTSPVDTGTPGMKSFIVNATDAAGNQASPKSVSYQVGAAYDSQVQLTLTPTTVTYPLGTNVTVKVTKINSFVPTGTIQIMDKGTSVASLTLSSGAAYYYLKGLSAGMHDLTAVYSGDKHGNPPGTSAPVTLNVLPVPVTLAVACWNTPYPYGTDFHCVVNASSTAGAPLGSITYRYDTASAVTVPLVSGAATIVLTKPPVGNHTLVITYAAQTNYAAAGPMNESFTVTPAPVTVQFTPSSWYLTKSNLTLSASIQSWSAGPPNALGTVIFSNGATLLSALPVPVNAKGVATLTIPASALPNGSDALTATYSGTANYASGSTTITVQVAH
jgi:hypothetical protein